jgi:hypothetical protein
MIASVLPFLERKNRCPAEQIIWSRCNSMGFPRELAYTDNEQEVNTCMMCPHYLINLSCYHFPMLTITWNRSLAGENTISCVYTSQKVAFKKSNYWLNFGSRRNRNSNLPKIGVEFFSDTLDILGRGEGNMILTWVVVLVKMMKMTQYVYMYYMCVLYNYCFCQFTFFPCVYIGKIDLYDSGEQFV